MSNKYKNAKNLYEKKLYKKAYDIFLALAEKGDVDAQIAVGNMLYHGQGIKLNINQSYKWFKIAAIKNHPEALYYCAMYYLEDIEKINLGKEYLLKAYELKYTPAIVAMAYYYEHGDHEFKKDENKAISLYKDACVLRNSDACKKLFVLLKAKKMIIELKQFIKEEIGYFKYLKIIMNFE